MAHFISLGSYYSTLKQSAASLSWIFRSSAWAVSLHELRLILIPTLLNEICEMKIELMTMGDSCHYTVSLF